MISPIPCVISLDAFRDLQTGSGVQRLGARGRSADDKPCISDTGVPFHEVPAGTCGEGSPHFLACCDAPLQQDDPQVATKEGLPL